jgi:hypothetical protein
MMAVFQVDEEPEQRNRFAVQREAADNGELRQTMVHPRH